MPAKLERALKRQAKRKGFKPGSPRFRRYVYGTLRQTGWAPRRELRYGPKR